MIDNADEAERLRRKAFIEKARAENNSAPRPTLTPLQQLAIKRRQREREEQGVAEVEEEHHFAGVDVGDLTPEARQAVIAEARRNAGAPPAAEGAGGLVYKTHAFDPQPRSSTCGAGDTWAEVDRRIDAAIDDAIAHMVEATGTALGEALSKQRKEDRSELRAEVARLWHVCEALQDSLKALRAIDGVGTTDLPNPLEKRRAN